MGDDKNNAKLGSLQVYEISNQKLIKNVKIGIGPDSIALDGEGKTTRAIIAIEDEETNDKGDATVPGVRPGYVQIVGLQDLYGGSSTGIQNIELVDALTRAKANYPNDPQPEFVSVNKSKKLAAVTLQENNAIVFIDLNDSKQAKLAGVYPLGTVKRIENADIKKDGEIKLTQSFEGRREPDAVTWIGDFVAIANEGDTSKDKAGIFSGSRSWSICDTQGNIIFDSLATTEQHAVVYGFYPDDRSEKKGVELEAITSASFNGIPFIFVGSERGSFIEIWQVDNPKAPKWIQVLPTGAAPEGIIAINSRSDEKNLIVAANEKEGSITIYQFYPNGAPIQEHEPQIHSISYEIPWGALSGMCNDGTTIYAVADNAFKQSRIFHINPENIQKGEMVVQKVTLLTQKDGKPLEVDPEGIAIIPNGGFWIASEGNTVDKNELIRVNASGVVQERITLPDAIQKKFGAPDIKFGFEGIAMSKDGRYLYVALQRGFDPKNKPNEAALLRYDTQNKSWISAIYPLEKHSKDPKKYWTGISEITHLDDGRLLILERDKGGSKSGTINSEIKRIYSINPQDIVEGATLQKTLVRDLRKDFHYLQEKAEGMTVFQGNIWVVNDNDGAGWTRMLNVGKI